VTTRLVLARTGLFALALLLSSGPAARPLTAPSGDRASAPVPAEKGTSWSEIERLIDEQRLAAALERLDRLEADVRRRNNDGDLARVLVRRTQLAVALGGYETAVEQLRSRDWPREVVARATVELYDAFALGAYLDAYGWEIGRRERIAGPEPPDLKLWTRDQIAAAIDRDLAAVWALREALGAIANDQFAYLRPNDYPRGIRPTLRDAVAYLWADRLADTSHWSPVELQDVWKLDLLPMIDGSAADERSSERGDETLHPLVRLAAVLGDLERWHRSRGELGAALEARLERLSRLSRAVTSPDDRSRIRTALADSLSAFRRDPWWAMGVARLAALWRESDPAGEPDALIRARTLALEGETAFPGSPGAAACRREREEIEAPAFALQAMRIDAPRRRSIAIRHRNLARLHLRAYRLAPIRFDVDSLSWPVWNDERIRPLLRTPSAAAWSIDLPATADYREHRTYATPPLDELGRYLVVASVDPDFGPSRNRLQAVELVLSNVVLLRDGHTTTSTGSLVLRALDGDSGTPLAGAVARLYRWQWERRPELVASATADDRGLVELPRPGDSRRGGGLAVVVRPAPDSGDEAVWQQSYWPWQRQSTPPERLGTLLFTDRSIYRPGQKLYWKTLTYQGGPRDGEMRAVAGRSLRVRLLDPNRESVAEQSATTNAFGTASGEIEIPAGRLLGEWTLETDANGGTTLAVEEYKRPTFEVTLAAPRDEPRLNRPVEIEGEARYYFGLAVTSGKVAWRVVREPLRDWTWRGRGGGWAPPVGPRTIASGAAEPDGDGKFVLRFTPEADEREKAVCGCYRFTVEAELTDDGGETRVGTRSLALGWVGVRLTAREASFLVGDASSGHWTVRRENLDGDPRAGESSWTIVELAQPESAPLGADLPQPIPRALERFATPGDRLRPRWESTPESEEILAGWLPEREIAHGALVHGADGAAALELPELPPGAYRLVAETRDAHGETARLEHSFAVVDPRPALPPGGIDLRVPLELRFAAPTVPVGGTAHLFVHSGLSGQPIVVEVAKRGEIVERRVLVAGHDRPWIDFPVGAADRGGFGVRAAIVADHQLVQRQASVAVPWEDKELTVELATFRDRLEPAASETYRLRIRDPRGRPLGAGAAELVASMYDRSLDLYRRHAVPLGASLYPSFGAPGAFEGDLGGAGAVWNGGRDWLQLSASPSFRPDSFVAIDPYGVGGPGFGPLRRMTKGAVMEMAAAPAPTAQDAAAGARLSAALAADEADSQATGTTPASGEPPPAAPRSNFAETAFWRPHLVTDRDGAVAIEFRVPESLTAWTFWASAWTKELASGYVSREVKTAKELMVRPYLPRFLREGDSADLKVVVQNGSERALDGEARFAILDPETKADLSAEFGLPPGGATARVAVETGRSADLHFPIHVPRGVRPLAFRVEARAGALSDGELRPLPVLPSRIRLAQSRFATIKNGETRELTFADMTRSDPTRIDEQLVVTVDGQLFYSLLDALPYLVDYPYECTEQTMNRFVSTGILESLFDRHPAVAKMARELAKRDTRWERFDTADPNRRMALEETPWLREARGGSGEHEELLRVLDPDVARAVRADALAKLERAQLPSGAFPWFPGGPPSPYMTLYLMAGFARAAEFGVEIPHGVVRRGWAYLAGEIERDWWQRAVENDCCWELLTFANYVASSYPDPSVMGDVFPTAKRAELLEFSFAHWKRHAPQSKLQLALTLRRMERQKDARLVLDSVMDSAKSDPDLGVYWAPEDRAWLWYNDTIETQAWALRALSEIEPDDPRREGLVQWLFLNKKLGHWKSTRATAEVIYSVASYLESTKQLGAREALAVTVGGRTTDFVFEPDQYTGKKNQIVLTGDEIVPSRDVTTVVEPRTKAIAFVSATWQFSTEKLPAEARGDLFHVERSWFRRDKQGDETTLVPLAEGERLAVGDELEIQLAIRAKAAAEYVHLRDPRPAGLEPDRSGSGWKWDLGLAYYEETRDSGTNFFFEHLPAGEYTLRYRLRANVAGTFRAAPAQLDSIYAPEFAAYSTGGELGVAP